MLARLARLAGSASAASRAGTAPTAAAADPDLADGPLRQPAGDFGTLVLPHLDAAFNLARYLTRDPTAAEDIAQEAMLRAFRAFAGYRGGSSKAWLLAIVRNCFLSWLQARAGESSAQRMAVAATGPDEERPDAIEHETPETQLVRHDQIEAVRSLIEHLPEPFREALVLRELEDLSYKEIAAITEVPIGTVMSRLARARRLLAEDLESLR
jgi:RNA polymerase sigma-70 factor (ECF subfamily)